MSAESFMTELAGLMTEDANRTVLRDNLMAYIRFFDDNYVPSKTGFHHFVAEKLEAVERGEIKRLIVSTPPQHGKLLADDTPILTNRGWVNHGELVVGDKVFGSRGQDVNVVAVGVPWFADREIVFTDGSTIVCHEDHEWFVRENGLDGRPWRIIETKNLSKSWTGKRGQRGGRAAYSVDTIRTLGLDVVPENGWPYTLGAWLGDGTSNKPALTFHPKDRQTRDEISKWFPVHAEYVHATTGCVTACFAGLKDALIRVGVFKNKHIPDECFLWSINDRMELLAGLMDTDGYIFHKTRRATFSNCNVTLVRDVAALIRSLGWRATIAKFDAKQSTSGIVGRRDVFQVTFSPLDSIPCRIPRKRNEPFDVVRRLRGIVEVRQTEPRIGRCIEVDADDGIYLAGRGLIPTHNSRLVTVEFPTWYLGKHPRTKIISASYAIGRAEHSSMLGRNRVGMPAYARLFGVGLSPSFVRVGNAVRRMDEWYLENAIGGYKAVGVGGGVTGFTADMIIIDDPHASWEEAHSQTMREKVWNWFLADLMTRRTQDAPVIIIMTRWHPDDLVGRLLDPRRREELKSMGMDWKWEVVRLPALAEDADVLGRGVGEPLFPELKSAQFIKEQMAALGTYLASALYRGTPVAKGGNYVDPDKLRIISQEDLDKLHPRLAWVRYWDLGATEADEAGNSDPSYTAGAQGAMADDGTFYVRRMTRGQWKWPKARERIRSIAVSEDHVLVGVEAVAGFKTAFENLREVCPERFFMQFDVSKDKLARALPWIPLVERGKMFLVAGEWVPDFKAELEAFPGGGHDDQVDVVSGLWEMLRRRIGMPMDLPSQHRFGDARAARRTRVMEG